MPVRSEGTRRRHRSPGRAAPRWRPQPAKTRATDRVPGAHRIRRARRAIQPAPAQIEHQAAHYAGPPERRGGQDLGHPWVGGPGEDREAQRGQHHDPGRGPGLGGQRPDLALEAGPLPQAGGRRVEAPGLGPAHARPPGPRRYRPAAAARWDRGPIQSSTTAPTPTPESARRTDRARATPGPSLSLGLGCLPEGPDHGLTAAQRAGHRLQQAGVIGLVATRSTRASRLDADHHGPGRRGASPAGRPRRVLGLGWTERQRPGPPAHRTRRSPTHPPGRRLAGQRRTASPLGQGDHLAGVGQGPHAAPDRRRRPRPARPPPPPAERPSRLAGDVDDQVDGGHHLLAHRRHGAGRHRPSAPSSRAATTPRRARWHGRWTTIPRGRCSWPATCRGPRRRGPRPPRCDRDACAGRPAPGHGCGPRRLPRSTPVEPRAGPRGHPAAAARPRPRWSRPARRWGSKRPAR